MSITLFKREALMVLEDILREAVLVAKWKVPV